MNWQNQHSKNVYTPKSNLLDAISIKIPMTFIKEIEKSTIKFIWKHKRPQIAKAILSKKHNALSLTKVLKIYDGEKTASSTKTAGKTG
jgi:hypothetical protein